jgi:hypothetical protein
MPEIFDDITCPFNYGAELRKAREALDLKLGAYISENPTIGYREIARGFGVPLATLCAIAKKYSRKRKVGRRAGSINRVFDVRHTVDGSEFITRVTVMREESRNVDVGSLRRLLKTYFKTTEVVKAGKLKPDRYARYTDRELHQLVSSGSALKQWEPLP